jgi:glyoxylase-like metal-dependent hydrolase (beta-lactamase superfamily II)
MVDDQFEPLAPKILAALATLGPGRPRVILNTHWHGDHVGGNKVFGPTGSIVAHRNVRARMVSGRPEPDHTPPAPREALPILTFDQGISVHFNDEEIRVIHLPAAHTDGDSVIWFTGSNVVHTGDLLFNGMFPFIDLDSGGSVGGYIAALEELLRTLPPDVRVIPGHGPPGDRSAIERSLEMLRSTSRTVREAKAAGKSLTEIQKAGLGAQWSAWAWAFIPEQRFIETLYRGL